MGNVDSVRSVAVRWLKVTMAVVVCVAVIWASGVTSGNVGTNVTLTLNGVILGMGGTGVKVGAVLPADATKFYDGTGAFSVPPGGGLVDPGSNGVLVRTALNTTVARTLTAGANITITNGTGVSGNPTIATTAAPSSASSNLTPVTVSANTTSDQSLQEVALSAGALNASLAATIIHGSGRVTIGLAQTPTLTFKAKLCTVSGCGSGTVVTLASITSGATLAATNNGWNLQLMVGTAATGSTGNLWVHGAPGLTVDIGALPGTAATTYTDLNTAVTSNIDLTAALFVDFTVATSAGSALNSITQDIAEILPQGGTGGGGGATGFKVESLQVGTPVTVNNCTSACGNLMTFTLPANELGPNQMIEVKGSGYYSTTGTPRLCWSFTLASNNFTAACLGNGAAAATTMWEYTMRCSTASALGASATVYCTATLLTGRDEGTGSPTSIIFYENDPTGSASYATNGTLAITIAPIWGVASTSNTITQTQMAVLRYN
jgi:hypothetical protein